VGTAARTHLDSHRGSTAAVGRRAAALALGLLAAALLAACGHSGAAPGAPGESGSGGSGRRAPLRVVATTELVAELARRVGGARVAATALMGPGTDPHTYKPSPGDVRRLSAADLVLFHGLHLEGRMDAPLRALERDGRAAAVAEGIPEADLRHAEEGAHDPHVWFDPLLWRAAAARAAEALARADPEGAEAYAAGARAFAEELERLDADIARTLAAVPPRRRVLATAHDAFGYFGRRYAFDVLGIQGISTESEASLRDIAALVGTLAERGVPAVFVESTVSPRTVEALVEGARARGHALRIGGELYSDAPGPAGSGAETIAGMSLHNARTIARALTGDEP
jgi:manganese/zinc/iron transport system substrate-binding protein